MKFDKQWQLSLGAVLLVTFIACNHNDANKAPVVDSVISAQEAMPANNSADSTATIAGSALADVETLTATEKKDEQAPAPHQARQQQQPGPKAAPDPAPRVDWDKKIIKNATLSVEVKDYVHYTASMRETVQRSGGYIAGEEQNQSDYKLENAVKIKVPVDQFDAAVQTLTGGTEKVLVRKVTSQDVTGEVVDTRSRLEAKREVRARYMDLLKQARNMKEILEVQTEINDIQEHMEAAAGRINYLTHSAAYSTIELNFFQVLNPQAKEVTTPPGFGTKILLALTNGLEWISELVVGLVNLWPLWIAAFAGWKLYRRYRAARPVRVVNPIPQPKEPQ
jgi:hypothetical protein